MKPVLATFTVVGPIIWCDNPQVRMWKILYINNNYFHHLGRSQMCAGAWYVFSPSKPHSGTRWHVNYENNNLLCKERLIAISIGECTTANSLPAAAAWFSLHDLSDVIRLCTYYGTCRNMIRLMPSLSITILWHVLMMMWQYGNWSHGTTREPTYTPLFFYYPNFHTAIF